jgi:hypothetical protein
MKKRVEAGQVEILVGDNAAKTKAVQLAVKPDWR